jgi:uncharacterized protein
MIYEARPFSCCRITSIHTCSKENPKKIHKDIMVLTETSIKGLQCMDKNGYSGHLSYILYLLSTPVFLKTYFKGGFKPEEIMVFGRFHKIIINKMME